MAYSSRPRKLGISNGFKCHLTLFTNAEFLFKVREIYNSKKLWEFWEKFLGRYVKYFLVKSCICQWISFSLKWGISHPSESVFDKFVWIPAFLCNISQNSNDYTVMDTRRIRKLLQCNLSVKKSKSFDCSGHRLAELKPFLTGFKMSFFYIIFYLFPIYCICPRRCQSYTS